MGCRGSKSVGSLCLSALDRGCSDKGSTTLRRIVFGEDGLMAHYDYQMLIVMRGEERSGGEEGR